jgi:signal transduction histidine kinase
MQPDKQTILIAILTGTAFVLLFGFFAFLVVLSFVKRKKKLLLETKIREAWFQQELLQAQLEMQDHTFKAISQEIHDNVGQILSLAKVNLNIMAMDGKGSEQLHDIKEMVNSAISELRNLTMSYYADRVVEAGLVTALKNQLLQLEKTGVFATTFEYDKTNIVIGKNKAIFLYRMIQEGLHNIVKHARADKVTMRIFEKNNEVYIELSDNGKGFDVNEPGFTPGIGLSSMQQRAAMIDANLTILSERGSGTTLQLAFKQEDHD